MLRCAGPDQNESERVISLEETNRCIALFGASQRAFMRSEKRAGLRSLLFDIPRRSSIGWHCFYEVGSHFLQELSRQIPPEEVGQRMKCLCSRPYYLTLSIIMCSYFGARQQRLLDAGLMAGQIFADEKPDEARFVVDFWRRACQAYRNDGLLLPGQAGHTQPILRPDTVAELNDQLIATDPSQRRHLRRLAATLELYSFILHGEQRDGIFAHGPYPLPDGSAVVVQEFTDLQNDFLPWAQTNVRNPYAQLALVLRLRGVGTHFDLFGGVLFDPADITPHVEAEGLFTTDARGAMQPIPLGEIPHIQERAAQAQNEIYLQVAGWTPRFKAEYGVHLFANHVRSFFRLVRNTAPDVDERIRAAFQTAAASVIGPLLARPEPPSIWNFMAVTDGDFFWPVVAPAPQ